MTAWTITLGESVVTLPLAPSDIADSTDATVECFDQDGDEPVLISTHPNERQLTLQGSIYVAGASNSTVMSTYLVPLQAMKGQEVTLGTPDAQYDGDWVLESIVFRRVSEGAFVRYQYVMVFSQGADAEVLWSPT